MRYTVPLLLSVLAAGSLQLVANDIEPGKENYSVIYAPKAIVLDGDLSEWSGVPVLADPKFAVPKYSGTNASPNYVLFEEYSGGTWSGPDDQTSAVQIAYDADNVYFGFVVTDDYHENMSGNAWNGDSIQLMIADAARTNQVALYNYALLGYEDNTGKFIADPSQTDPVMVNHEAGPAADATCDCATTAVIKRDSVNHKTIYEIKLPKAALGLTTLKGGVQFGLGMAINDGDGVTVDGVQYGQAGQEGQKGWGGLGAHAIVFGKTPSETALITLNKGNDIEPTKEYYTALRTTNTITIDGVLSDWPAVPVLADPKFAVPKYSGTNDSPNYVLFEEYSGGTWSGPNDQTSAVQIAYDADSVYFGFVVTDDYHENMSGNAWNGDSVQLMIADAARTNQVALYNYALLGYEDNTGKFIADPSQTDPVMVNHEAGPATDATCDCATSAVIKRDSTNHKTIYEIKLPAASLGLTPPLTSGTKFGLGMAINDGDGVTVDGVQYGQAGQEGQKGWGGLGAHAIVFGKTPSETALVTLGGTVSGSDSIFLSAVNDTWDSFSFRANDKGKAIVDVNSAKLVLDSQTVTLTASAKTGGAVDYSYKPGSRFAPGSKHTYSIEIKDTAGNVVISAGSFTTVKYGLLTKALQASSVDTSKPGFLWYVFQNEAYTPTDLADTELALTGKLVDTTGTAVSDNNADPSVTGPALAAGVKSGSLYKFEIPTVINLSLNEGDTFGYFAPNNQMPGIPGVNGGTTGIDAEVVTFVEFPVGTLTMGVVSDDGFRMQAGYINKPADAMLMSEMDNATADVTFKFVVQDAGIYPIRVIWNQGGGTADLILYTVKSDGTKVLLNDTANGGYKTYRSGVAPNKPTIFNVAVAMTSGKVQITWTESAAKLQQSTDLKTWTDVSNASSPFSPTVTGTTASFYRLKE